jgi:hypothetical protein
VCRGAYAGACAHVACDGAPLLRRREGKEERVVQEEVQASREAVRMHSWRAKIVKHKAGGVAVLALPLAGNPTWAPVTRVLQRVLM